MSAHMDEILGRVQAEAVESMRDLHEYERKLRAPVPPESERKVLGKGWAMQSASGEPPIQGPLMAFEQSAWDWIATEFRMSVPDMKRQWPCLRAVYVEIVEVPPPEGKE